MDRFFCVAKIHQTGTHNWKTEMTTASINIIKAIPMGEYRLQLTFDDGTQQTVDFKPFLLQARHPDIRAYLDSAKFLSFRIEYGELIWGAR